MNWNDRKMNWESVLDRDKKGMGEEGDHTVVECPWKQHLMNLLL